MSSTIRPMDQSSVQRIVAGQAVTDLASAVKELVDNALDAGATVINIRLFDQGASIVEVSDDGCGIPPESRTLICTPHSTSKLIASASSSNDASNMLDNVTTLGFRGEALFSLANLSKTVMVATRTADEELATKLEFQSDGSVRPNSTMEIPKKVGTTVAVVKLFDSIPVRRHDFVKRLNAQRTKLLRRMEAYLVFAAGVSMHLMDMVGTDYFTSTERTLLQTTNASKTLADSVSSVLGPKVVASLCKIVVDLSSAWNETATVATASQQESPPCCVEGLVSHAHSSKKCSGVRERQLFAINRRPVDMPKLSKRLNLLWKAMMGSTSGNNAAKPFVILNFTLPPSAYDVNLEPDKRKVVLEHEDCVFNLIQEHVARLWSEQTDGKFSAGLLKSNAIANTMLGATTTTTAGRLNDDDGAEQSESDNDDNEEVAQVFGDTSSPSRFTRRYAFVNDVRRMRLQHQYDDGRATSTPEQEEARKKEVMAEMADDADDSSDDEVIPKLALRPAHEQEFFDDEIEEAAINAVSAGLTGIAHITPHADEHKGGEALDDIRNGSVAPVFASALHRRMLPSETRRSGILQRSGETAVERVGMMTNSFDRYRNGAHEVGGSQAGLDRYGFASMRSSSQTVSVQSLEEVEQLTFKRNSDASMPDLHFKRQRRSALHSTSHLGVVTKTAVTTGDGGDEVKAEQRRVSLDRCRSPPSSADDDEQEDGDDDDDDVTQPALPTQDHPQREALSIVFDAFTGTGDAVLMSRRERLALRDRRLRYENSAVSLDIPEVQTDIISLSKEDFSSMRVIGQFNLGFILAVSQDCNLWILDQHACDEKFNFEKLMAETIISEQRLISPMPLELMPAEESCIMDNMEIFEKNGFRFKVDWDKQPRHRLSLTALPHSGAPDGRKAVQFGKEDVSALCHILGVDESSASHDGAAGTGTGADGNGLYGNNAVRRYTSGSRGIDPAEKVIVRLPKAIAMFASRACRGSIMIGQALSQKNMDRIVKRLQDVDHPWNCPHGRPTMRHVLALESLLRGDDQKARELIGDTATTMMSQEDAAVPCSREDASAC